MSLFYPMSDGTELHDTVTNVEWRLGSAELRSGDAAIEGMGLLIDDRVILRRAQREDSSNGRVCAQCGAVWPAGASTDRQTITASPI